MSLAALLVTLLAGCGGKTKTALTPEEFTEKIEAEGYDINPYFFTDGMPEGIETAVSAVRNDGARGFVFLDKNGKTVRVEYYLFENEKTAKALFEDAMGEWENQGWSREEKAGNNFTYCVLTGDGEVRVCARVGNTMIGCHSSEYLRDEMEALMEKLGYK